MAKKGSLEQPSWELNLTLVLQIPCQKVFRHPKPTLKPLAEGIGA